MRVLAAGLLSLVLGGCPGGGAVVAHPGPDMDGPGRDSPEHRRQRQAGARCDQLADDARTSAARGDRARSRAALAAMGEGACPDADRVARELAPAGDAGGPAPAP